MSKFKFNPNSEAFQPSSAKYGAQEVSQSKLTVPEVPSGYGNRSDGNQGVSSSTMIPASQGNGSGTLTHKPVAARTLLADDHGHGHDHDLELEFDDGFNHSDRSDSVTSSDFHESRRSSEIYGSPKRAPVPLGGPSQPHTAAPSASLPPVALSENGHPCAPVPEERELKVEDVAAALTLSNSNARSEGDATTSGGGGNGADFASGKLGPEDFEMLHVVGQGAFGKVFQVRMKSNGAIYAMKVMKKEKIVEKGHIEYLMAERDILTAVHHPYIVTLRFSFQTATKLYLILDFINGGHLFFQLYHQGTFDEPLARLYTAELVLAIGHLHARGIVHRDLKPENILLDHAGHIRLTDFGLAKHVTPEDRSNSFIGTLCYMAPEIIAGTGHGKDVDWWSVGVLLFEMLVGMPPFRSGNKQTLQKRILTEKIKYPAYLSSESLRILKALLERDPKKRLGAGEKGAEDVKAHPFFKGVNWKKLEERQVPSPFLPTLASSESVENFDKVWTDMPPIESPCGTPTKKSLQDLDVFKGFTYVSPSILARKVQEEERFSDF